MSPPISTGAVKFSLHPSNWHIEFAPNHPVLHVTREVQPINCRGTVAVNTDADIVILAVSLDMSYR